MFGRLPLRHVNPDQAIALGACIAAGLKSRDQRLEEIILTDVCPYTLGTAVSRRDGNGQVMGGLFSPIIHRNSTVPVSREETYYPLYDNQKVLNLDVYQGESPMVDRNIKLGEMMVALPPNRPASENGVRLRFTYDINGVLQAEATVLSTGEKHELILEQNPGLLSPEEIRARLAALQDIKIHPRDKQENIAVLARAERLYEEHLQARDTVQQWIAQFRQSLETQDEHLIREHRGHFSTALDQLERQL